MNIDVDVVRQKTISVCVIGKPNAGKSSLLNKIIGQKISIVTQKVQTTRSIITGILTINDTQIVIFDTPGIFEAKKQLEKAMVRCAWSSLHSADIVMLIIDATKRLDRFTLQIIEKLKFLKVNPVFLLNKIDLISNEIGANNTERSVKRILSPLTSTSSSFISKIAFQQNALNLSLLHIENIEIELNKHFQEAKLFKISALSGQNIDKLITYISDKAALSPFLYPKDDVTSHSMRFLATEVTREVLFLHFHEELPYNLTVETENWQEKNDKSVHINQVIIVSKDNYKSMILGKSGAKIKEIGIEARLEMQKAFNLKIHLFLFVKVRDWENMPDFYHQLGLQFEPFKP